MSNKQDKALQNAIIANPDDLGAHAAYADWLTEQGDARGEFIQLQLALEDPKWPAAERKKMQNREKSLLKQYEREWLGELAHFLGDGHAVREDTEEVNYEYRFERGFLRYLKVQRLSIDVAETLARSEAARTLSRLVVEGWYYDQEPTPERRRLYGIPERSDFPSLYPIASAEFLKSLRVFQLGEVPDDNIVQSGSYVHLKEFRCHTGGAFANELVRRMPALVELHLFANNLRLDQLFAMKTLKNLRVLQIYHAWDYPLETLARNRAFSNLTHLLLHPKANGAWNDDCPYIKMDGVRTLLRSKLLSKLIHLQLRLTTIGDDGCRAIVDSGILKQLKSLDLRHGCITDEGAHILSSSPDIGHLESLDLSRNQISKKGVRELKNGVKHLVASHQQSPEEIANAYEPNYFLHEGDYE